VCTIYKLKHTGGFVVFDAVIQEHGAVPASGAFDDQSISAATVFTSSCGCGDQASVDGAGLGADEIEQMINDKLAPLMAMNIETVDGKLAALHADLQSQQLVMAELANKQQASEAQQQRADADRSANIDRFAELVCNFISLLFVVTRPVFFTSQ